MEPQQKALTPTLPNRPKRSAKVTNVVPLKLVSNHMPIIICQGNLQSTIISQYSVHIEPELPDDARRKKRELVESARKNIEKDLGSFVLSGLLIFSPRKKEGALTFSTKDKDETEYLISVKHAREFDLLTLQNQNLKEVKPVIQFLNILIKQTMKNLKMNEMGRTSKYVYNDKAHIALLESYPIEVRTGFKTSIEMLVSGVKLQVDYCSRILRTDNVLEYIKSWKGNINEIKETLIGSSVLANYSGYRYYKIDDIDFKKNPQSTFDTKEGPVTYMEYFKKKYSVVIKDNKQPLLMSTLYRKDPQGNKVEHIVCLIPELCRMTGLTDEARADFSVMKELAYHTKLEPTDRMDRISSHINNLNKELKNQPLQIKIGDVPQFTGNQIRVPEIKFKSEVLKPSENGSFQLRSKILQPCILKDWILMYSGRGKQDDDECEQFYFNLQKAGGTFGIKVEEPFYVLVDSIKGQDYQKYLEQYVKPTTQCVVAFIPKNAKNTVYKAFKKFCAQDKPVPSQVVVKNSLYKNALSVCSKIICQINAKLGLSLWVSQIPENLPKKVMIIGADVHHGKKGSVIGLCASFDDNFTKYYSRIKVQKKNQEIMVNISSMISDSIQKYFKMNKYLPETIIFYRDGVGEGQFNEVREIEIPSILNGFTNISAEYKPQFCEVIVTKKINDRFFTPNGQHGPGSNKYYNPPSGTWVSEHMVSSNYDFFLCAQNVTQGTCTPTHYTVLHNNTNISEDVLAKLTYYQCFNYFNWTGAIRVPACVQYASKLAFLVGQTLQADPHESLWDKLYFL